MENPILISNLNDFIFCPASIYFHNIEDKTDVLTYQQSAQLAGSHSHKSIDEGTYSDKSTILQSISVFSEKYGLIGKIDIYDITKNILIERKRKIATIYDGYVFQLYAQYFALLEMGYNPQQLHLYSCVDNKTHLIKLPCDDTLMFQKFEQLLCDIQQFEFLTFKSCNVNKCNHCIYETLCYFSCAKGET